MNQDFIARTNNFSVESVGKRSRHKIAMAIDTLNSFEIDEQKKLFKYIHRYRSDIKMVNGTFLIGSETELQGLLCGIEEQYYTTVIREEKRVANSVRPLKTNTGAIP